MCVRIAVFYQARRVSGHICVLGLQCFTRPGEWVVICVCYDNSILPGQESESSYVCVRIAVFYQARRVSRHICVLGLQCFTRPGE